MKKNPTGSLYQKNGYYYARVYYYVDDVRKTKDRATSVPVDGRSPRKSKQNQRAAEKFLNNFLHSFTETEKQAMPAAEPLLTDTAKMWLEHVSVSKAPGTVASYANIVRDIGIYFGKLHPKKTVEVTTLDVEKYLDWERMRRRSGYEGEYKVASRSADDSGIENTVLHRYTALRSILQFAQREGIIIRNVASSRDNRISPPRPQRQEFSTLTREEAAKLLHEVYYEPSWFHLAVYLGLIFGLRRSEIVGLQETDVDWSTKTLTVRRTVTQQTLEHKNRITSKPFTKNRKPKVFGLDDYECSLLKALAEENKNREQQFGAAYDTAWDAYLMRYPDGKLVSPNALTQRFQRFLEAHNFKKIRFHDLRHSCASLLCERGVDVKTIQEIMGHLQLSTTMTYIYYSKERKADALSQMREELCAHRMEETEVCGN